MPRHRFIITSKELPEHPGDGLQPGSRVILGGEENHHLKNVLRLRRGELFEGFEPKSGVAYLCEITDTQGETTEASVVTALETESLSRLVLLLGAPKPATLDFAVEKAVELGASELHIFRSERSQADKRRFDERNERLNRVICSAVKQCRSSCLPTLTLYEDLSTALFSLHPGQLCPGENRLMFCALPESAGRVRSNVIRDIFTAPSDISRSGPAPVSLEKQTATADFYVLIGPEGGLTQAEMDHAAEFGYRAATLGPNVLRTETAVILALGLIRLLQTS